jgi:hypothetical protein
MSTDAARRFPVSGCHYFCADGGSRSDGMRGAGWSSQADPAHASRPP